MQRTFIDFRDTILDINVLNNHYKSILKENDRLNHALLGNSKKKSIESIVYYSEKDVFPFLIFQYPSQPNALRFRNDKGSNFCNFSIGICYEGHGSCRENTLVGFHIFTVDDQTGRFMRKSKTLWWKNLNLGNLIACLSHVCFLFLFLVISVSTAKP